MAKNISAAASCPCGGETYANCCQPYHLGTPAPTAEALMRSRYSAYALGLENYLLQTWHRDTRPAALGLADDAPTRWLGLQIKRAVATGDDSALVEFIARYKAGGKAYRLHEISRFIRLDGQWVYQAGKIDPR